MWHILVLCCKNQRMGEYNNNLENNNEKGKNKWLLCLLILMCPQSPTSHVIVPRVSCLRWRKCIIVANKLV